MLEILLLSSAAINFFLDAEHNQFLMVESGGSSVYLKSDENRFHVSNINDLRMKNIRQTLN